jgi:hypothetical protein
MTTITEYNFFLDSKYRTSSGNPNPKFELKEPIFLSNSNHKFVCMLKSVDIPYSFKSLASPYNVLRVRYQEIGHVDQTTIITIPDGNYSITQLLQILQSLLTAFITPITVHAPSYDFSYDRNTGKCTLLINKLSGNHATYITLYWSDLNTDFLAEFFGFTGNNNSIIGYLGNGTHANTNNISEINVNCSPISSIYVRSSTLTQPANNEEYLTEFDISVSDILLKIPVNTPYGTWILYNNSDTEIVLNNKMIDVIELYITHLSYMPISLQGVHWRCHLYIKEVRDAYLDEIEKISRENESKVQELEQMKTDLLSELDGLSSEMRSKIPQDADQENKMTDIDDMKIDLLNEIEQRRNKNAELSQFDTQQPQETNEENNMTDVDDMKDDLLNEVEQRRKSNLSN